MRLAVVVRNAASRSRIRARLCRCSAKCSAKPKRTVRETLKASPDCCPPGTLSLKLVMSRAAKPWQYCFESRASAVSHGATPPSIGARLPEPLAKFADSSGAATGRRSFGEGPTLDTKAEKLRAGSGLFRSAERIKKDGTRGGRPRGLRKEPWGELLSPAVRPVSPSFRGRRQQSAVGRADVALPSYGGLPAIEAASFIAG